MGISPAEDDPDNDYAEEVPPVCISNVYPNLSATY